MTEKKKLDYPKTDLFAVVDTIPTEHYYMVGPKHVAHAADNFSGRLGKEAIEDGEKKGIHCYQKGCNLSYDKHKLALVVEVSSKKSLQELKPQLEPYLLSIKDQTEKEGYEGWVFKQK